MISFLSMVLFWKIRRRTFAIEISTDEMLYELRLGPPIILSTQAMSKRNATPWLEVRDASSRNDFHTIEKLLTLLLDDGDSCSKQNPVGALSISRLKSTR